MEGITGIVTLAAYGFLAFGVIAVGLVAVVVFLMRRHQLKGA